MPSRVVSPAPSSALPRVRALDDYGVDDEFDDPFRSPSPEPQGNKRKHDDDALGLDEEVSVAKRARVPRVKLDETLLLSDRGIPKLRKRAKNLRLKGKGHEFSDAARLLAFYQLWLDDLFPKAKFLDALAMVERVGHRKVLAKHRLDWINEDRRRPDGDGDDADFEPDADAADAALTPGQPADAAERPQTPGPGDVPDDEDIYGATPRAARPPALAPAPTVAGDEEDDLDALLAEAEAAETGPAPGRTLGGTPPPDAFADEEDAMAEMDGLW